MTWLNERRILVPFDFSDESVSAVKTSLEMASSPSEVYVLYVLAELSAMEPGVMWETVDDESRKKFALNEMEGKLAEIGASDVNREVWIGDAGHAVADYAEKIDAGLIVIPSHGRRGLTRLLLGSVAERVVRLATRPVLVLKPSHEQ